MLVVADQELSHSGYRPKNTVPMLPTYYTVDEIAGSLRLDKETIRRYIRIGKLQAIKVGREYRVTSTDLTDFMNKSHV